MVAENLVKKPAETPVPLKKYDINAWVESNRQQLMVYDANQAMSQKISMYEDQLMAMWVGGGDIEPYFHLEEGEELFYQKEGDVILRVGADNTSLQNISIKEGQIFLLPRRIWHNPLRPTGSLGVVIERSRGQNEMDCLRFPVDRDSMAPLWEKWFHCENVPKDFANLIGNYMKSESKTTGKPSKRDQTKEPPPFNPNFNGKFMQPIQLADWLEQNSNQLKIFGGKVTMYGAPDYDSEVVVYGNGSHKLENTNRNTETYVWQLKGNSEITIAGDDKKLISLSADNCVVIPANESFWINCDNENSRVMTIQMPTPNP